MTIGVTGSRGFIGSYLSRRLLARQHANLRLLVRSLSPDSAPTPGVDLIRGDLNSPTDCSRFADGVDLIYYLAHTNTPVNSDLDQANDAVVNLVPLLNLIDAIRRQGNKPHVVYFSSGGAVYAPKPDRTPYRETDFCAPLSSYGVQKLAAEHYLRLAAQKDQLTATVLRVGNAYGTLLSEYRMQGLIGVAINNILHKHPVRLFGNLNNVRDYVHLEDICEIADRASIPKGPFGIVNVGSGVGHSVLDVLGLIEQCHGAPIQIHRDESCGHWLTDWAVLDTSKALQEFGWSPAIDLRSGVAAMMTEWNREIQTAIANV